MQCPTWINTFHSTVLVRGTEDIIPADSLRERIAKHDGATAFHLAFDLVSEELKCEEDTGKVDGKGKAIFLYHPQTPENLRKYPLSVTQYAGSFRGAMGYAWFDFDSKDGGHEALRDAILFVEMFGPVAGILTAYSGSKGFHVGIPDGYLGISPGPKYGAILHAWAAKLKKTLPSIDTTVFNPQRKFRALNSIHPKTGLYKILVNLKEQSLDDIKALAKEAAGQEIPLTVPVEPLPHIVAQMTSVIAPGESSIGLKEWRFYQQPEGTRAMQECGFLAHCKADSASLSEPEWYAAAGIVGRFKDGRAKFQVMSKGHRDYDAHRTDEKLEQALQSAGPRTCKGINELWGKCSACPHFEKIKSPVVILEKDTIATEATGFRFFKMDKDGKATRPADYAGLVHAFARDFKYFIEPITEQTYVWTGTNYERISDGEINAWCELVMEPAPRTVEVNEFRAKLKRNRTRKPSELEDFFFATTQGKLNLKNGILHIADNMLTPHDDRVGFRYVLPYDYDPSATAPVFEKFMQEVTLGREDLKKTLLEFMGYTLWPAYEDHCFLWLSGTGRNGKSTLMEIMKSLVGKANVSNVLLSSFEKPAYLQMMDHKLLNIGEETDAPKIPAEIMGTLKALSAGAEVQVDQKYEVPYSMRATAKLVFAANKPPHLTGTEDAIKARMIVVPFELELEKHGDTATESKIDWTLTDKMRAELPGILNLCLGALRDFVAREPRKLYRSATTHSAMNEIMRDSDYVEAWFQDCVKFLPNPTDGNGISIDELFGHFKAYHGNQDRFIEQNPFSKRLKAKLGKKATQKRERIADKQTMVWRGISVDLTSNF